MKAGSGYRPSLVTANRSTGRPRKNDRHVAVVNHIFITNIADSKDNLKIKRTLDSCVFLCVYVYGESADEASAVSSTWFVENQFHLFVLSVSNKSSISRPASSIMLSIPPIFALDILTRRFF